MNKKQKTFTLILLSIFFISFVNAASFPSPVGIVNTIETNPGTTIIEVHPDPNEKEDTWSEKQICKFINGCLEEDSCYPLGYMRENQYCEIYENKWGFE